MAKSRVLAALAVFVAGAVGAETEVDAYGLGPHEPVPESWLKLDDDLSIRVRVLNNRGEVAAVVAKPEELRAEVALFGREGAADRDVRLVCTVHFVDAEAGWSDAILDERPCFKGRLSEATGQFVPMRINLWFRPVASDPAGTSAVVVEVKDLVVEDHVSVWVTYDWQGGRK